MKPKNDSSRAFIDLAKMGRSGWRTVALTILLIAFLSILSTLVTLIFTGWSVYFKDFRIVDAGNAIVSGAANPLVCVFGFWLACKRILRRPFRSLISTDLTFSARRCLLGAALFLLANVLSLMAITLYASMRYGAWMIPFGHFEWPHSSQVFGAVAAIIGIPFFAFAEELFFRGWLTQTLGQYIRVPMVVVVLVAMLFAAYHTQYDLQKKTLMLVGSLGLSALCLRDQRLELAIGAHLMMNICVVLQILFFTGPLPHVQTLTTVKTFDWLSLVILKGALPLALMYWLLQKTTGWYVPAGIRAASTVDRLSQSNGL
jgi:uncharacterized protein